MTEYRIYRLDERGGIGLAEEILADSDQQALEKIGKMNLKFRKCELWDGHRMVAALDGGASAQPAIIAGSIS